jgi:hypothetical protein
MKKMKKNICYLLLPFLLLLSCKRTTNSNEKEATKVEFQINSEINNTPLYYLEKLILSSTFPFTENIHHEKIHVLYDSEMNDVYLCKIYADDYGTLGWVKYDAKCKELYDITGNVSYPRKLDYNRNLESKFIETLKKDINSCSEIRECKLPFDYLDWIEWQTQVDKTEIEDDGRYTMSGIYNNLCIDEYYNGKGTDTTAYHFLKLNNHKLFDSYIIELGYNGTTIIYNLLNVDEKGNCYELIIGKETEEERIRFLIDESLKVFLTIEKIKYDKNADRNIVETVLNNEIYQIQDDGQIVKIE